MARPARAHRAPRAGGSPRGVRARRARRGKRIRGEFTVSNQGYHLPFERSHKSNELSSALVGATVHLMGWVSRARKLGGVNFVDLRDRYGHIQIVVDYVEPALNEVMESLRMEDVIAVEGKVRPRP